MTKMIVEKWLRGTSRASSVMFPGQSHISRGMAVLGVECLEDTGRAHGDEEHALVGMSRDPGGHLQVEGLFCGQVIE